jgi:hypothetical protein
LVWNMVTSRPKLVIYRSVNCHIQMGRSGPPGHEYTLSYGS